MPGKSECRTEQEAIVIGIQRAKWRKVSVLRGHRRTRTGFAGLTRPTGNGRSL